VDVEIGQEADRVLMVHVARDLHLNWGASESLQCAEGHLLRRDERVVRSQGQLGPIVVEFRPNQQRLWQPGQRDGQIPIGVHDHFDVGDDDRDTAGVDHSFLDQQLDRGLEPVRPELDLDVEPGANA
jgi:hypothetical protein